MRKDLSENKNDRIGEVSYNRYGSEMKIIDYKGVQKVIVQFKDGYTTECQYNNFKLGRLKNPYDLSVYGIGYYGEGKYRAKINDKCTKEYKTWQGMLSRCYDEKSRHRNPTYKNCTVCDEWHNFQNFAKWYDENYYEVEEERMALDKDILVKGNKVYSPKTCVFVPQTINSLFLKKEAKRGNLPIGVLYDKKNNCYRVSCSDGEKLKHLGVWKLDQLGKAFNAYKTYKEKLIKNIADEYKNKYPQFPQKLYDAMYEYQVEITD